MNGTQLSITLLLLSSIVCCAQKATHTSTKIATSWHKSVQRDKMEGTLYTSYLLSSTNKSAVMELTCSNGKIAYLMVNTSKILNRSESNIGRIRIDKEPAESIGNGSMVDEDTLKEWTILHDDEITPRILAANTVLVELPVFSEYPSLWEFHPKGINKADVERTCGISFAPVIRTEEGKAAAALDRCVQDLPSSAEVIDRYNVCKLKQ